MPGGDGTGPLGYGPGTGGGRGGCAPAGTGRRMYCGRGTGLRRFFPWNRSAESDPREELGYLENLQKTVSAQIEQLRELLCRNDVR